MTLITLSRKPAAVRMFAVAAALLAGIVATLALAGTASGAWIQQFTAGNGQVSGIALGPRWVAWSEYTGNVAAGEDQSCVRAAHADVGLSSQRTLWCEDASTTDFVNPFRGLAVGTRHIVAATIRSSAPAIYGLHVYDIDTGSRTFIQTSRMPRSPRIDGTRLVWIEQPSNGSSRIVYRDLSQSFQLPLIVTESTVPNGSVWHCVDISGNAVVYSESAAGPTGPITSSIHGRWVASSQQPVSWRVWGPRQGPPFPCPRVSANTIVFKMYYDNAYVTTSLDGYSYYRMVHEPSLRSIEQLDIDSGLVARIVVNQYDRYILDVPTFAPSAWILPRERGFSDVAISGLRVAVRWGDRNCTRIDGYLHQCFNPIATRGYVTVGRIA